MRGALYQPVLILNASLEPISFAPARRALVLLVKGAAALQEDLGYEVHAGFLMPSVIRLKEYRRVPYRLQKLTRKHILIRDRHQCQYCGRIYGPAVLTLDHVLPRSRGGQKTFENLVTACKPCNRRKADQTPEEAGMPLLRRPRPVTIHTARGLMRAEAQNEERWQKYLYFDNEGSKSHVLQG